MVAFLGPVIAFAMKITTVSRFLNRPPHDNDFFYVNM